MEHKRVYVQHDEFFQNVMPHSEVCMHMGIAGKEMGCKLVGERPMVQLYDFQTWKPFSAPILTGEAGVYTDADGGHYVVRP